VNLDEAFAKVVGRQASEQERERLYRLREALGLRDNDAFWSIVMALEYYDAFFRQYPAQLAEETARCIESARAAFALAAAQEAARAQHLLSEKVAQTSVEMARKLAERPVRIDRVTTALASVVAFGALCVSSGYHLASTPMPFWVNKDANNPSTGRSVFAAVLAVPAGWMIFALLVPAAGVGAKAGWAVATDALADPRERILGGCLVLACAAGCVASALVLARVM
jgi:hypothetical protein